MKKIVTLIPSATEIVAFLGEKSGWINFLKIRQDEVFSN